MEQIESLVRGLLQASFPIPPETIVLGVIGIAVIIVGSVFLIQSLWPSVKSSILPPIFEGEIFGENENKFLVGGTICFRARYRGNLQNGYFTAKIRPEELHKISDTGREYEWLVDYNTRVERPPKGMLNGRGSGWLRKSHSSVWGHKIPFRYDFGKYTATLMVFDDRNLSEPIEKVPLTFTILDEELTPLRGWTSDGQLIPAPRSMFVKKPRRRSWLGTLQ